MKFIPVRELRNKSAKVWESLRAERELVLTSNGRPIALVTEVNGDDLERQLKAVRHARAALALEEIRRKAREDGVADLSFAEIDEVVAEVRRERRAKSKVGRGKG